MILTCPACQSRYVVPDSAIGSAGRKVRCAKCRYSWFQEPPDLLLETAAPAPAAAPAAPPPPFAAPPPRVALEEERRAAVEPPPPTWENEASALEEPPFRPRRNPAKLWTIVAILAAALMVGAFVAIQYFGVPRLGQWIGIPVQAGDTLIIADETAQTRRLERGNDVLEVAGFIVNQTDEVQRVPQIQAELKDAQDRVVYSWTIAPPVRELQPRGRVAFNSANVGVPRGGRKLSLTFGPVS